MSFERFYELDTSQRRVKIFNREFLQGVLEKHGTLVQELDLRRCTRITDQDLLCIARLVGQRLASVKLDKVKGFTLAGINCLARACVSLKYADFSYCSNEMADLGVATISQVASLSTLKLMGCYLISDEGLECLAWGCQKLEGLVLRGCLGVSDTGIGSISCCKLLTFLDVSYTLITDRGLRLLSILPSLEVLKVSGCSNIGDEGLIHMSPLLELDISHCKNITESGVVALSTRQCSLQHLNASYCVPISGELLRALGQLQNLQVLKLDGNEVSGDELGLLGKGLQELSLSKCTGVTDSGLCSILSKSTGIRILHLTCCDSLSSSSMNGITRLTRLETLKLEACQVLTDDNIMTLGRIFLKELDLTECNVSDAGLYSVASCSALRKLKLGYCSVGDRGLQYIAHGCKQLVELDLYRSASVGDAGVAAVANGCSSLSVLNLSYCANISDEALASLSRLGNLKELELRGCSKLKFEADLPSTFQSLVALELKRCTQIGDAGIRSIASYCPNLQELNLSYCSSATSQGLMNITRLPMIQSLKVVRAGNLQRVEQLEATLLECKCLKKVKLLRDLRPAMRSRTLEELQNRGCKLKWMN